MPIEALVDRNISAIHDLIPVEKKTEGGALQQYQRLQDSPLWDAKRQRWGWTMSADGEVVLSDLRSTSQLYGVLAEGLFNRDNAQLLFEQLKMTKLYDKKDGLWFNYLPEDQTMDARGNSINNQLLAVLVEGLFDTNNAQSKLDTLKHSLFFDHDTQLWRGGQMAGVRIWYADHQLLGVLAEGKFDKDKARLQYDKLKQSNFYIDEKQQWRGVLIGDTFQIANDMYFANDQLLGVLIEGLFDKEKAGRLFGNLRNSEFYDPVRHLWKQPLSYDDSELYVKDQLMGVIVEKFFEEDIFMGPRETLPAVRRF